MVSLSNTSVNVALCLTAMLMETSITQAQLSNIPKRYRNPNRNLESSGGFASQQRQKERQQQQQRNKTNLRKEESRKLRADHHLSSDPSMPALEEMRFEIYMPIKTGLEPTFSMPTMPEALRVSEMSMPIEQSEMSLSQFDMSMPLIDASWDMSMPIVELLPTDKHRDEFVSLDNDSGSGNTLILTSFLAGISALVVGAMALFVKMRRVHGREADETEERKNSGTRVVSSATQDELNVLADEGHDSGTRVVSSATQDELNVLADECHDSGTRVVSFAIQDELNTLADEGHDIILV